jgi:hypothetical protein
VSTPDVMAAQLAQLLTTSDRPELEEVVRRWKEQAVTRAQREAMEKMGEQILALKAALDVAPERPSPEELELALRMMMKIAGGGIAGGAPPPPRAPPDPDPEPET